MKLDNTYKQLSQQARNLMKQGQVQAYLKTLIALNKLEKQMLTLKAAPTNF